MNSEKIMVASNICAECANIGTKLGQSRIIQLAESAALHLQHSDKLRIAVISAHLKGAVSAIEEIFDFQTFPKDMDVQDIHNSVDILLVYGDEELSKDAEKLLDETDIPITLTWHKSSKLLSKINVEIIVSCHNFSDFDWKKKLEETDYVFMVTSASCLLTASEREFMEMYIRNYLGASRFAVLMSDGVVINNPDDYDSLINRINWCLGLLGKNSRFFELGTDKVKQFVFDELVCAEQELADLSAMQTAKICLLDTRKFVEELAEQAFEDVDELEAFIKELQKRQNYMIRMGKIAASKAHSEIIGNIQYSCNETIRKFINQLHENISDTISRTDDISHAANMLPQFLSSAEKQCMEQLQSYIEIELVNLENQLKEDMMRDAGEFFGQTSEDIIMSDPVEHIMESSIKFYLDKDGSETKKRLSFYSKALLIGSVPAVLLGYILVAIGTIIGSQIVKNLSKDKIESENREVLLQQVHTLCQTLQAELQDSLLQAMEELARKVECKVNEEYEKFVLSVLNKLAEKKEQVVYAKELHDTVTRILKEQLPELERHFE